MTTAIVFNEEVAAGRSNLVFKLRGKIFARHIDELGHKIQEVVSDLGAREAHFVVDLTQADIALFKPLRLFGVCAYVADEILRRRWDTGLALLLREEHRDLLPSFSELPSVQLVVQRSTEDCEQSYGVEEIGSEQRSNAAGRKMLFTICVILMGLCIGVIAGSLILFANSLLGFALSFSGGIIGFEALIILRALQRTSKK